MGKNQWSAEVHALAAALQAQGWRLVVAESCTGGWIAKACTDIPGSSAWFDCGFVSYSNNSKQYLLEVAEETLAAYGAVSEPVVAEMVRGAIANSQADVAVAVSGIAGPEGGSVQKPVGMVCFAWLVPDVPVQVATCQFAGDRDAVRSQAVGYALQGLLTLLQ